MSKMWSLERIHIQVELSEEFLLTGGTSQTLEISPCSSASFLMTLVPLECGLLPLPHVRASWERTKLTVFEMGSSARPKHVFVLPSGRE